MMKSFKYSLPLELECWEDDLSPVQLAAYEKAETDHINIKEKLKDLFAVHSAEEVYLGDVFSAYQINGDVSGIETITRASIAARKEKNKFIERQMPKLELIQRPSKKRILQYDIDADDDEDVPLVKRIVKTRSKDKEKESTLSLKRESPKDKKPQKSPKIAEKEKLAMPSVRPSEISSIGGLTVDSEPSDESVTSKSGLDTKEMAINALQGKTFPSLVVVAKPSLSVKETSLTQRNTLDSKVKLVLMFTAAKFTEWLIQQGLLKSEQACAVHNASELKLGVYSDGSKFPYSGGYVWISECCPTRFVSVFHGSLFEGAPHPPSCILKLIYHWSCQTNIQNVVQWVKVDNVYIKGIYTWLRAVCTLALQDHLKPVGGPGKYIEVGVISLGTTTNHGQQRQVKVEVLGVLDPVEKIIRLRAIQPFSDSDKNYKKRFSKILEPLADWVRKDSIIAIDLTVDKNTLHGMGYKNVVQAVANDSDAKHTNSNVMDYLRRIVPRMFQNTLSLLSRQIIQQFLDELVWREQYGTFPLETFDNITKHIAEQTRIDSNETLTQRLYKVATNPFNNWKGFESKSEPSTSSQHTSSEIQRRINRKQFASKESSSSVPSLMQNPQQSRNSRLPRKQDLGATKKLTRDIKSEITKIKKDDSFGNNIVGVVGLEELFCGVLDDSNSYDKFQTIKNFYGYCPQCKTLCSNNITLQTHIFSHINISDQNEPLQCIYCLEKLANEESLEKHVILVHPVDTKNSKSSTYSCIICENRLNTSSLLTSHMQRVHVFRELPYKCFACNFRSSSHRKTIDHFYEIHQNSAGVQCPFCLTGFRVFEKGESICENMQQYFSHVQKHLFRHLNTKCNRCSLWFINKGSQKAHLVLDHKSHANNPNVKQLVESKTFVNPLKIKAQYTKDEDLLFKKVETFNKLSKKIEGGKLCLECDIDLEEDSHVVELLKCEKCRYQTCCLRAMLDHTISCELGVNPESNVHITLDNEMHCVCGFSSSDGNSLARHLVACEHKSAYPSVEVAQENTVKRNMLDMLGLIRREEDNKQKDGITVLPEFE